MRRSGLATLLTFVIFALGCVAVRDHDERPTPASSESHEIPRVQTGIAVRRPTIDRAAAGIDQASSRGLEVDHELRIANAERQLSWLRAVLTETQIEWLTDASDPSALQIEFLPPPPSEGDADGVWAFGLTLGVIPQVETHYRGVHFKTVGIRSREFHCPWKSTIVMGWVSLAMLPSKVWNRRSSAEAFEEHLRQCVAEQAEVFDLDPTAGATPHAVAADRTTLARQRSW